MKISIIIPVYNSEKYLRQCLDSVLAQTYTDFEALLIDDGSTDGSGAICDEYAARDARFKVFHKENGGVSSARNLGIDNAQGEWICFVDSDDLIQIDFLKNFKVETIDADLYIQGFTLIDEQNNSIIKKIETEDKLSLEIGIILERLEMKTNIIETPWSKLFKTDFLKKHNIYFDELLSNGEDHLFVLKYFQYVRSVFLSDAVGYMYNRFENATSLIHRKLKHQKFEHYNNEINEARAKNISIHAMSAKYKQFSLIMFHSNYFRCIKFLFKNGSESTSKIEFNKYINKIKSIEKHHPHLKNKRGYLNGIIMFIAEINLPFRDFLLKYIYKN